MALIFIFILVSGDSGCLNDVTALRSPRFLAYRRFNSTINRTFIANSITQRSEDGKIIDISFSGTFAHIEIDEESKEILSPKDKVLSNCEPNEIVKFPQVITTTIRKNCRKIAEGCYGEVFSSKTEKGEQLVLKIVAQNMEESEEEMFARMLPELTILKTFNLLRNGIRNQSPNYLNLFKAACVKGKFPKKLVDEWHLYNNRRESENQDPRIYGEEQLYLVLQLANGGMSLEAFNFTSAVESISIFQQISFALAAAEKEFRFEHRDLHWGNILISPTANVEIFYVVNNVRYVISTNGVLASIIDFSASRISTGDGYYFLDFSTRPDLFEEDGIQFDIYRKMRDYNQNNWQKFSPYSNIIWLSYILDKLIHSKNYVSESKAHRDSLDQLKNFSARILIFNSAYHFVKNELSDFSLN